MNAGCTTLPKTTTHQDGDFGTLLSLSGVSAQLYSRGREQFTSRSSVDAIKFDMLDNYVHIMNRLTISQILNCYLQATN